MLGIPIRESCVTCIHAYSLYEYDNRGLLIPESRHYVCKIKNKKYYEPDTPTNCRWYHETEYYKWKKVIKEK